MGHGYLIQENLLFGEGRSLLLTSGQESPDHSSAYGVTFGRREEGKSSNTRHNDNSFYVLINLKYY
jgi:hypothetical protein